MNTQDTELETGGRTLGSAEPGNTRLSSIQTGLGAWASAVSADDNAQAAIALAEAINRARNEFADRQNRASDSRIVAVGKLETLRARLSPIYAAIPRDVDMFDLGVVGHVPPRLFIDIIAFIEMTEDGRGFRLFKESRTGRVLLGETTDEKQMVALVTHYIAERLVERERALASQAKPQPLPRALTPETLAAAPLASGLSSVSQTSPSDSVVSGLAALPKSVAPVPTEPPPAEAIAPAPVTTPQTIMPATMASRQGSSGNWFWPLLALVIGIGLGALALYLYALSLNRI
jgi:hypothetical protein